MTKEEDVIAEVRSALERQGMQASQLSLLSPQSFGRKSERLSYRIDLDVARSPVQSAGGFGRIKARRLESAEEAARLVDLRARVDSSFAPVLAREGCIRLERWIDGVTLTEALAERRAEDVGALLGRLHAASPPVPLPPVSTRDRRERALVQLTQLEAAGAVDGDLGERLRTSLLRHDPQTAPQAIVHMDYCPENLVEDPSGRLHAIDNEWLRYDAPGLDLGRTYSRWPMSADVWRRFLDGYAATSPFAPRALPFWQIVMAAAGAVVRLHKSAAALAVPVARLRELAVVAPQSDGAP